MGQEADCKGTYRGSSSMGRAHLETKELWFRGDFQLKIHFKDVRAVEAKRGVLFVEWGDNEEVQLELGKAAEAWMLKIRYPKGRLDKLGVKEGMRVAVIGVEDGSFLEELAARQVDLSEKKANKESDIIFYGFDSKAGLEKLESLKSSIKQAGAIWTVYPKGQKTLREADVMAGGKAAGLVDTKVVGFSDTHSSLKWVIPVAKRK